MFSSFQGIIEYWDCESFLLPSSHYVSFTHKTDTDLYAIAKSRSLPTALSISSSGDKFAVMTADRQLRVFDVKKGKLLRAYDESLASFPVTFFIAFPLYPLTHFFFYFLCSFSTEGRRSWGSWADETTRRWKRIASKLWSYLSMQCGLRWIWQFFIIFLRTRYTSFFLLIILTFLLCIHCVLIENNSGPLRRTVICYSLTINSVLFYEHFRKHFYTFWSYSFSISC